MNNRQERTEAELEAREAALQAQAEDGGEQPEAIDEEQVERWMAFFEKYPQLEGFDDLPEEVRRQAAAGEDPEIAYLGYENALLRARLAQAEGKKAAPRPTAAEAGGEELDAFQRAFMETLRNR